MPGSETLTAWSHLSFIDVVLWLGLAIVFLYVGRIPAHKAIRSSGQLCHSAFRMVSRSFESAERRLRQRNKDVVLAFGREAKERLLEREFQRVDAVVRRDLAGFPALNRTISEQITRIEEDYRNSTEVPPAPPEWLEAVDAVARIPGRENSVVGEILEGIHTTLESSHKNTMREYRNAYKARHDLLRRMVPHWRRLAQTMSGVERKMSDLEARIPAIDEHMQQYEQILAKTERAERTLMSSFTSQFFVSGLVLTIAVLGGFINFHLIALPMSEMVGGNSYVGPLKTADVAAMVIILIEIAMGIFLMESLRVTRMFPSVTSMDEFMRRRMVVVTLLILVALAGVEAALAYMRDLLAADKEALTRALSGVVVDDPGFRWIASAGQMVLGFILPFALTCAAISLEAFVNTSRVVAGASAAAVLRFMAVSMRMIGNVGRNLATVLTHVYDIVVFLPLWLEQKWRVRRARRARGAITAPMLDAPVLSDFVPEDDRRPFAPSRRDAKESSYAGTVAGAPGHYADPQRFGSEASAAGQHGEGQRSNGDTTPRTRNEGDAGFAPPAVTT